MKKRKPDLEAIRKRLKGHDGARYHELRLMARGSGSEQTKQEKRAYYTALLQELARRNLVSIEQHTEWVWMVWHPLRPERPAFWTSGSGKWRIDAVLQHRAIVEPKVKGRHLASLLEALGVKEDRGRSIEAWLKDLDERRER